MNKIFDTYRPDGFRTINPYLFAERPKELIDFLKNAFFAEEIQMTIDPKSGDIANCILKIGDTCLMISQARGPFMNMRTSFYLFVEDVDTMYERAIEYGAKSELKPADMDYGDRQAGVQDASGNYWWISKRLEQKGYQD